MGVRKAIRPMKPQAGHTVAFSANQIATNKDALTAIHEKDWVKQLYLETRANIPKNSKIAASDPERKTEDREQTEHWPETFEQINSACERFSADGMRKSRKKATEPKIQTYGRGRPRKKSFGKKGGNSNDKQSQDGSENGEGGRSNRGRQRGGGGQGSSGSGGRRRKDEDERDDDNDDVDDEFDENNEEDDEEDDDQTGAESATEEAELTPEQEAEMAQVSIEPYYLQVLRSYPL